MISALTRDVAALRAARRVEVETAVAFLTVVVVAANRTLPHHLNVATIVGFALLPVWMRHLPRFAGASTFMSLGLLAIAGGLLTSAARRPSHGFDVNMLQERLFDLTAIMFLLGMLLWARTLMALPVVSLAFGIGLLGGISFTPPAVAADWNVWKFGFVVPLTIIGLSVAWLLKSRTAEFGYPLLLAPVSALNNARSSFGILVFTSLSVVLMSRNRDDLRVGRRRPWVLGVVVVGLALLLVFHTVQSLILAGWFGAATQQRTQAQLDTSGNLLLGGRPEAFATLALIARLPMGFGLGVPVSAADLLAAKAGMAKLHYDPNNGYVENYMFGGQIELHSATSDLWAAFGVAGLIFVAYWLFLLVRGTAIQLRARTASALVVNLFIQSLFSIFFNPLSFTPPIVLLVALVIADRRAFGPTAEPAADPPVPAQVVT